MPVPLVGAGVGSGVTDGGGDAIGSGCGDVGGGEPFSAVGAGVIVGSGDSDGGGELFAPVGAGVFVGGGEPRTALGAEVGETNITPGVLSGSTTGVSSGSTPDALPPEALPSEYGTPSDARMIYWSLLPPPRDVTKTQTSTPAMIQGARRTRGCGRTRSYCENMLHRVHTHHSPVSVYTHSIRLGSYYIGLVRVNNNNNNPKGA